jgi:ferredoxin
VKIQFDAAACTGHGRCYALAPHVFRPDDQGRCIVVLGDVPPELRDSARLAVENCPERALSIDEESS